MNKIKYTTALLLGGLLSFSSCTDNFADFNIRGEKRNVSICG